MKPTNKKELGRNKKNDDRHIDEEANSFLETQMASTVEDKVDVLADHVS